MDPAEKQNPAGCIWWCWYQGQLISQYVGQPVKTLHFCSNTQKVLYCIFFLFTFLMMAIDHLFLYNKRTALND